MRTKIAKHWSQQNFRTRKYKRNLDVERVEQIEGYGKNMTHTSTRITDTDLFDVHYFPSLLKGTFN